MTDAARAAVNERRGPAGPSPRGVPVAFGSAPCQLFGLYHAPLPAVARASGVVLCNPLGHEAMCSHRTYRRLGERLASAGLHALRFDYHGTGDSAGTGAEPGRVRAWLDGIGAAIDELRAITGVRAVSLFGVRFGATLAALCAARRRDVDGVVLWAPCVTGRAYVRELRALRMIQGHIGQDAPIPPGGGGEEIAGYLFEQATMLELTAIDLLSERKRVARRALVVSRDDLPGREEQLAAHLEATGVETRLSAEPGYARMMSDPQDTVVPYVTLDRIVDWAAAHSEARSLPTAVLRAPSRVLAASSHTTGRPVREQALTFGDGGRLFGILTELESGGASSTRPALVFLNVGANHRVGPNRMYVTLARDLAALGYHAFRFDVAGLGDSGVLNADRTGRLYSIESVSDVRAAITFLAQIRGVERVVLVGLCSGAYLAFHAALADSRVAGQVLINPATFEWKEGDSIALSPRRSYKSTRYYLGELLDRRVWMHALRGEVDVKGIAGVLWRRLVAHGGASLEEVAARWGRHALSHTDVELAFTAMCDRGVESLLVFSSMDGGLDMIEEHLGRDARKVRGRKNMRLAIVAGADHTFSSAEPRRQLNGLITTFVETAFPASGRPPV